MTAPMTVPGPERIDILVSVVAGDWTEADQQLVEHVAQVALGALNLSDFEDEVLEVSLALADDDTVQGLNRDYRNQDKPTNVLSFDNDDPGMPGEPIMLGDVILARQTCQREAEETGISFNDHLSHLTIHGVLHLLGYDHISDADAEVMEAREIAILAGLGIENPYMEHSDLRQVETR